jgi:hypothetical protein
VEELKACLCEFSGVGPRDACADETKSALLEDHAMPERICIEANGVEFHTVLNDTTTARAIADALPIAAEGNRWGGEIYFSIPVKAGLERGARDVLKAGQIGYWPPGTALCLFFGPTPASEGNEIRAASDVNIVGRIEGKLDGLWNVPDGAAVLITRLSDLEIE